MELETRTDQHRSTCIIAYQINPTSKMSDYDYSDNPNIRFISTYIHELIVYDLITNQELSKIKFSTETSYDIINNLKEIITKVIPIKTIRNIYAEQNNIPIQDAALVLERLGKHAFGFNIISKDSIQFVFDENQIQSLIILMETKNNRLYED